MSCTYPLPCHCGTAIRFLLATVFGCLGAASAVAQIPFEEEPINYEQESTENALAHLQRQLDAGEIDLPFDEEHGYLQALLKHLEISPESQVLVYSKTSFQLQNISPRRPRALYFNDHSYVGWVQGGDVLEVMTTDPQMGQIFYTIRQDQEEPPLFVRDRGQCIVCHASSRTQRVPGGLVRSAFVDAGGMPHYGSGTFNTDHSSPFSERWGGWYVTGTHGDMRHMGNAISKDRRDPENIDRDAHANITDLSDRFDTSKYLTPHSDIVALMVLEHQLQMHNFLTLANFEARRAAHHDKVMNEALERPADHQSDTTKRRIANVGEKLLRYMLMVDEFPLTSPVAGTSRFAEEFVAQGICDSKNRTLRQLNLKTRLFEYPCSYLIYSESFDGLPLPVKQYVARRLDEVLSGEDTDEAFAHLTPELRQAIREILQETKPDFWTLVEE